VKELIISRLERKNLEKRAARGVVAGILVTVMGFIKVGIGWRGSHFPFVD